MLILVFLGLPHPCHGSIHLLLLCGKSRGGLLCRYGDRVSGQTFHCLHKAEDQRPAVEAYSRPQYDSKSSSYIDEGGAHLWGRLQGGEQVQLHQVQRPLLQRDHLQPGNGGELVRNYVEPTFFSLLLQTCHWWYLVDCESSEKYYFNQVRCDPILSCEKIANPWLKKHITEQHPSWFVPVVCATVKWRINLLLQQCPGSLCRE